MAGQSRTRQPRREQILEAAVELFQRDGYHATGIDEIGATAGITGPAVYRHFASKEDILETLLLDLSAETLATAQQLARDASTPGEALRTLVEFSVDTMLDNPALAYVAQYERRTLPRKSRIAIDKAERLYFEEWVQPLMQLRPELSEAEARVVVYATAALAVAATTYKSNLGHAAAKDLIVTMMLNTLTVPERTIARQRTRRAG
ncbi:MAG TPA: helix-turn-helix domain-containing protein [Acidimicrobiales bacterium]|nr:helix-turn-helix domain-containing protein [Acidimicrobiales bacterium]